MPAHKMFLKPGLFRAQGSLVRRPTPTKLLRAMPLPLSISPLKSLSMGAALPHRAPLLPLALHLPCRATRAFANSRAK